MLFGLLDQQPRVILYVNLTQQYPDQPTLVDNVNEFLILARLDTSVVQNQHAYLLELNVILRPVEHLVVQFATLSAIVFILGEVVEYHVDETWFVLLEFIFFLITGRFGQEVDVTVFVFADLDQ